MKRYLKKNKIDIMANYHDIFDFCLLDVIEHQVVDNLEWIVGKFLKKNKDDIMANFQGIFNVLLLDFIGHQVFRYSFRLLFTFSLLAVMFHFGFLLLG